MTKSQENKLLSIVVPTYNVENYLERCINSLTSNKEVLKNLDILIVNDGSKDDSVKIARHFESRFPDSIRVLDKENGGHGSTINEGLSMAKGKYFRVLDSDDWFNVDDFAEFISKLKTLDSDFVLTNYSKVMAYNGEQEKFKFTNLEEGVTYSIDEIDLDSLDGQYFYMSTTTTKTEVLRRSGLRLSEKSFYVDMEYNIFPIKDMLTFIFLDLDIYRYWIGRPEQSMDVDVLFRNRGHHKRVYRRLMKYYTDHEKSLSDNKKLYINNVLNVMATTHYHIYINSNSNTPESTQEIKQFDSWLKNVSPEVYYNTEEILPYLNAYRKTGFIFLNLLPKSFRKIADRASSTKKEISK